MAYFDEDLFGQCSAGDYHDLSLMGLTSFEYCKFDAIQNFELPEAIKNLSPEHPFLSFDLQLSENEHQALTDLRIASKGEYENFAELQNLTEELTNFFNSLSPENNNISFTVAKVINRTVNNFLASSKQDKTAWVVVKALVPSELFDIPDWHTDPCLSNLNKGDLICKNNEHYAVFVVKGAATIFYPLLPQQRDEFNFKFDINNYQGNETHVPLIKVDNPTNSPELQRRLELGKMLDNSNTISIEFGQGYVFLAGSEYGAVHTTPPVHDERVFIAVYPGDRAIVKQLEERMKVVNLKNEVN